MSDWEHCPIGNRVEEQYRYINTQFADLKQFIKDRISSAHKRINVVDEKINGHIKNHTKAARANLHMWLIGIGIILSTIIAGISLIIQLTPK